MKRFLIVLVLGFILARVIKRVGDIEVPDAWFDKLSDGINKLVTKLLERILYEEGK